MAEPILDPGGDLYTYGLPDNLCQVSITECVRHVVADAFPWLAVIAVLCVLALATYDLFTSYFAPPTEYEGFNIVVHPYHA